MFFPLILGSILSQEPGGAWTEMAHWLGPEADSNSRFGQGLCGPGDLDQDGVPDICIGAPRTYSTGRGKIFVRSGSSFALIRTILGTHGERLGHSLAPAGDVDLDGTPDILTSGNSGSPYGDEFVRVLSGATGLGIRDFAEPPGGNPGLTSDFGYELGSLGDVDRDGVPDLYVTNRRWSLSYYSDQGVVYVFSGATGSLLYSVFGDPNAYPDSEFGIAAEAIADVDGDGAGELLVTSMEGPAGTIHCLSGATGQEVYRILNPGLGTQFGACLAVLGDMDGDLIPEFASATEAPLPGSIVTFSGATGRLLGMRDWLPDSLGSLLLRSVEDVDGDRFPDLLVRDEQDLLLDDIDRVTLVSGASGRILRTMFEAERQSFFGNSMAGVGDLNADGRSEFLIGAFTEDGVNIPDVGGAYVYGLDPFLIADARVVSASSGGTIRFALDFPQTEGGRAYKLLAAPERDGPPWLMAGGIELPLAPSPLARRSWHQPLPGLQQAHGVLNANGDRIATLSLAPGAASAQIGRTLRFAAVTLPGTGAAGLASAAVTLTIAP